MLCAKYKGIETSNKLVIHIYTHMLSGMHTLFVRSLQYVRNEWTDIYLHAILAMPKMKEGIMFWDPGSNSLPFQIVYAHVITGTVPNAPTNPAA